VGRTPWSARVPLDPLFAETRPPVTPLALALAVALTTAPDVKVRTANVIHDLPLDRYVAAVLAGESSVFTSPEALRAAAVAARTYALHQRGRHAAEGYDFCATTHCQRLDLDAVTPRLTAAADSTAGELLWFNGHLAFTPYTADCGGRTEDAAALWPDQAAPYLRSHDDPWCRSAGASAAAWQWTAGSGALARALRGAGLRAPEAVLSIAILERTPSGRARTLAISGPSGGAVRVSAGSFRFAVGRQLGWNTLRSDRYEVSPGNGQLRFSGSGLGHGVGLCQRGADRMGADRHTWREILAFYYPGTAAGLTAGGLAWQRLAGQAVTLLTTRPQQDAAALAAAERLAAALAARTHWPVPPQVELRVYPDVETFRNATGEPGWVAARSDGRRIHLQPVAVLRRRGVLDRTLAHELAHVLVESQAAPDLPLWFREGLAEWLSSPGRTAAAAPPPPGDRDLRQKGDAARARRAYASSAARVAEMVRRCGEAAVLACAVHPAGCCAGVMSER
jgi:stage II sporulation protein D